MADLTSDWSILLKFWPSFSSEKMRLESIAAWISAIRDRFWASNSELAMILWFLWTPKRPQRAQMWVWLGHPLVEAEKLLDFFVFLADAVRGEFQRGNDRVVQGQLGD